MLLTPRDYQEYAIDRPFKYFEESDGNPLILMPCATGKSVVVGGICERALRQYPQTRILMLTETKELVKQNYDKLKSMWLDAPVGIFCDGLDRKEHHYPLTFGTIGSVINVSEVFGFVDLLLVDEADGISEKDDTMYRQFILKLRLRNPKLKVIGLTATGYRTKQGPLTAGKNALFTDVIVDMTDMDTYNWFFDEGYLVPPVPRPTKTEYDLTSVKIKGGDYDQKSLHEAVDNQKKNEAAILELLEFSVDRHCGLIFASGVAHCKHLLEILQYYQQDVTWVASREMSPNERDYNLAAWRAGEFKWIVNNGILTVGLDHPPIDVIGMLRHTLSVRLWVQMLGRGTRPYYAPGYDLATKDGRLNAIAASQKQNTMVLDFAENVTRLGQINAPRIPKPSERKRKGDAPIRLCEDNWEMRDGAMAQMRVGCGAYNHAGAVACWACHAIFPRYLKIGDAASTNALVKDINSPLPPLVLPEIKEMVVDRVVYMVWRKADKPDSIKVMYHCGVRLFAEWICLEHGGFAARKAREWWRERANEDPPETTAEAYDARDILRVPRAIKVVTNKPNGEISDYVF